VPAEDFAPEQLVAYDAVLRQMARPYRVDRRGRAFPSQFPARTLDASLGLVSTVRDLARFHAALDAYAVLQPETLNLAYGLPTLDPNRHPDAPLPAFAPVRSPFALGWFVQAYDAQPVVWHFGYLPDAGSALVIKLPYRRLTLIMLANSDGLSGGYALGQGDVTTSPFARLFLSLFG
jgi:hypothetical protein